MKHVIGSGMKKLLFFITFFAVITAIIINAPKIVPVNGNILFLLSTRDLGFNYPGELSLPVVLIDTNARIINNEDKINGRMKIIQNAGKQSIFHKSITSFDGLIGIRIRGWSSQTVPKKQYSVEVRDQKGDDLDASLLGMPAEADWVLYAPYSDKSLMRNVLVYELSNQIGLYAPRTRFVELFLNETEGKVTKEDYRGIYVLIEKIKRDKDRVDIAKNQPDNISGGYILELAPTERIKETDSSVKTNRGTTLINVYPKAGKITDEQKKWITNYMSDFENVLYSKNYIDPVDGYRKFIDVNTCIDYMIINELVKNPDAYYLSTFINKDKGGKLKFGPVWDYNIAAGNANFQHAGAVDGWLETNRHSVTWTDRLLEDDVFVSQYIKRWKELRQDVLSDKNIDRLIDSNLEQLTEAQVRNFNKWDILGQHVWPNPKPCPETYEEEISYLRQWLHDRCIWIDEHIEDIGQKR